MLDQAQQRHLPSVHLLVEHAALQSSVEACGRQAVVRAARQVVGELRQQLAARPSEAAAASLESLCERVRHYLDARPLPLQPVLNATGVVLHTNLGRAPLGPRVRDALLAAAGYCDVELDLETGKRASRLRGVEAPLTRITGAAAGMVVNNNAAAVLLAIATLAGKRPTAVSRGHLVEIGGGCRLPTIIEASGSALLEIGTTNRTHLGDYEAAIDAGAALILWVHQSNFVMHGFVAEPALRDVVALGRACGVPVALDLGSGALLETASCGVPAELTVPEAVRLGLSAICFSGDKLLGGPQAGFVVGDGDGIERMRRHPLARALRCDKLQLAALLATLDSYDRDLAEQEIPIWQAMRAPSNVLHERCNNWQRALGCGDVIEAPGAVGGGSLPDARLPGWALALTPPAGADRLAAAMRAATPPVVGHIERDRVLLHARTVAPLDDAALIAGVRAALDAAGA